MRSLILALQFLTRLPTPPLKDFRAEEQAGCVVWFPLVGLLVGALVAAAMALGAQIDPWLGALLGLAVWVGVTGALHLDGLADLADALGAAHRDRERLLAVLADPHLGVFGAVALFMQLLAKLVLLMLLARAGAFWAVPLIAAWGRWGVLIWTRLPSIKPGLGERFGWRAAAPVTLLWGALLGLTSAALAPALLIAPLAATGWFIYLRRKLGGMTGDALGAGVEWNETLLLAALAFGMR
ncbi:MAG: adenosylcobinamide-GDP ribazoletransferase [Betaproteobacteria bacterium]|nr:adenosylcobinamide-GDP ribazoletransferase [Betaproteobacteria bacterium]